jgi:alkanesulfonate monooxygenase SsuD/methylene tetrahydromethanopterin reductase-like flavin-dependent oxidoreductase (luciferase family)
MEIGIGLPNAVPGADGSLLMRWAQRAEQRGFSTLATIGRVAYPTFEEIAALSAAAAVTSQIGLVTNVLLAPTRNFVLLAKEAATLDRLSNGRFTLGIAVGDRPDDYTASEQDMATRGHRFEAGLDLMHRAWRGELVSGAGKPVTPRPVRNERVPILIGGNPPLAAQRTTRWGVGWTLAGLPPEMAAEPIRATRQLWADAGTTEGSLRIVVLTYFSLGSGTENLSRDSLLDYYDFLPDMAEVIADSAARGEDEVKSRAQAFEQLGIDELIFDPTVPRLDQVDLLADVCSAVEAP